MKTVPHNLNKNYRPARMSGVDTYHHEMWVAVNTSAGRDWDGSCYTRLRGVIGKAVIGGWLALTTEEAETAHISGTPLAEAATHYPSMMAAYGHIRPCGTRRRDFGR